MIIAPVFRSVCQVEIPNFEQTHTDYSLYYICLASLLETGDRLCF